MNPTKKRLRLCMTLILVNLCFIWGNSLLPGEISGALSEFIKEILRAALSALGLPPGGGGGGGLLRKVAHFSEFACLGGLLTWYFSLLAKPRALALAGSILTACMDETIQCFVPDRGPSIMDVGLDTTGAIFGILLGLILINVRKKKP